MKKPKGFGELALEFVSAIANLPSVTSFRSGITTSNSVTVYDIVLSREDYNKELLPLLKRYTNDETTAEMTRFSRADDKRTLGQTYYYQVQLTLNNPRDKDENS